MEKYFDYEDFKAIKMKSDQQTRSTEEEEEMLIPRNHFFNPPMIVDPETEEEN